MIRGAMRELRIGDPAELATDVGPLIEAEAVAKLMEYVARAAPSRTSGRFG